MYIDNILRLSGSGQQVTTTAVSTDTIDLAAATFPQARDIGEGRTVMVNFVPTVAATSAAADTTVEFQVIVSTFAAPKTVTFTNGTEKVNCTAHGLVDGQEIRFYLNATGVMPTGLSALTTYYVKAATASDFEVALSPGGATVTFTDDGTAAVSVLPQIVVGSSGPILHSTLTVPTGGAAIPHPVEINPKVASLGARYLMARYQVRTGANAAGTLTAGTFLADLVMGIQDGRKYYASGFAVT